MDWDKGYSASYYATIVDPITWADGERIEITGGSIKHTDDELLESADVDIVDYRLEREQWIRVWLDTRQDDGGIGHTPLFTGVASTPSRTYEGTLLTGSIQCYSVLKIAQDMLLERGWYAPVDIPGATIIRELLSPTGILLNFQDSETRLQTSVLAEDGENRLTMAWKIAKTLGWLIQILGNGTVVIGPYSTDSKWMFSRTNYDIVEPSISIERDWFNCPNVLRAIVGNSVAIARDDNPESELSTVSRGREIWVEETDITLNDGQSLGAYAFDRLKEYQDASLTVSYDRRFVPDILVGDIISLDYPEQELTGNYLIKSQTISLGHNAKTSEEVIKL